MTQTPPDTALVKEAGRSTLEARFQRLVHSTAQGVFFWNVKGEIIGANDAFLRLVQFDRADLEAGQLDWQAMTPPEFHDVDRQALRHMVESRTCNLFEKEFIRRDGSRVPVRINAASFDNNTDEGVCFVFDLTENKALERQFLRAQKLDSIGSLAVGIAHDFNNLLALIQIETDFLSAAGKLTARQTQSAEHIVAAVRRAAALTRQLLLFGRREGFQPQDVDLNECISEMTKLLTRIVGEDIDLQLNLAPEPLILHADCAMMDQVLLNLVVNARDAMPRGGRLVIETTAVEHPDDTEQAASGSYVRLSVSDSGGGIAPNVMPRLFEPFFSTKAAERSAGLGLSTVASIVERHHGWIEVLSDAGSGTVFRVYLPRLQTPPAPEVAPASRESASSGGETILLVEDDVAVRSAMEQTLSNLGYPVVTAPTGTAAMDIWRTNRDRADGDRIRVLVTDLIMPDGLTGNDLARRLQRDDPRVKVIFMSGYRSPLGNEAPAPRGGVTFLAKPFKAAQLAAAIRRCLDSR